MRRDQAWTLVAAAIVIGLWYLGSFLLAWSGDRAATAKLPYPHLILGTIVESPSRMLEATWATASTAVVGFVVGAAVGLALSVLMIQARWIEAAFMPYLLAAQLIPLVALVPILRQILRNGDLMRLYIASFVTFFIVAVAALRGLKNANRSALELMDSFDASRWTVFRYLRLPAALPFIFSGLRVAAPLSLIGAILVDFLGARSGLGYLMIASLSLGGTRITVLWAALAIALVLGFTFTRIVAFLERRLSFWQPAFREEFP